MKIRAICIGTEILRGDILNTNLAFLGRSLERIGLTLASEVCVPDKAEAIREALNLGWHPGTVLVTIGGLGPTADDITRTVVAERWQRPLVHDAAVEEGIRKFLRRRAVNIQDQAVLAQSLVPEGAEVLENRNGTAPGLWCEVPAGPLVVMLPGPPAEFKPMVEEELLPRLRRRHASSRPLPRRLVVCGLPESRVEEKARAALVGFDDIDIAYCAEPMGVRVCLEHPDNGTRLDAAEKALRRVLAEVVLPAGCTDIRQDLATRLQQYGLTLAVAESCTGGLLAGALTEVPGASAWFVGGAVTYANRAKTEVLGVAPETLAACGAVSVETVEEMLRGVRRVFSAGAALAVSGIAGPGGGSPQKPVGTVILGVSVADMPATLATMRFPGNRETVRHRAVGRALVMLRENLVSLQTTETEN